LEALDRLNLAQPMLDAAQKPQPPLLYLSGQKTIARVDFARFLHRPYPYQLVIWQQRIERVLEAELRQRGPRVERATRLISFEMDDDGVMAHVERNGRSSEVIRAGRIVGCDGGHSTVRKTLGLKMEGTTLPEHLWLGEFDIEWKRSRDTMYVWWHKDGLTSALYIDFTQKWHVIVECDKCKEEPTLERMRALFSEQTGEIDARLKNPAWMGTLTINQRMPGHFMMVRAFLAGDAAHVHSAAGGQGMNIGMQDAMNLGWKLALTLSGAAASTLLQTYESERLPNAQHVLAATQRYQWLQIPHSIIGRLLAGTFTKAVMGIRPFGEAMARRIGMLNLNYQKSSLSRHNSRGATPHSRAGWRVPDAPCKIDNQATMLFEIIRGTHGNLFFFVGENPSPSTISRLRAVEQSIASLKPHLRTHYIVACEVDADNAALSGASVLTDGAQHLQTVFGLRAPEIIYVRPDGYIGLRTQNLDGQGLLDYLDLIYAKA